MSKENFFSNFVNSLSRRLFEVKEDHSLDLGNPRKFLIVRQHNQLGDLLAGVSLFRAIKETYPESHITLIVSPFNFPGLVKNKFIDRLFVFDKRRLYNPFYLYKFIKLLREEYDAAIVPVVVSISFTSNFIAGLSNTKIKIGAKKLDGKIKMYIEQVMQQGRIKKGSKLYEHGISIARSADLLGISQWQLLDYVGKTTMTDATPQSLDVKKRLSFARELFRGKK